MPEFPLKLTFPVYSFRRIPTPYEEGDDTSGPRNYIAIVRIQDLPVQEFPMDTNPRAQNLKSRVARKISEGLTDSSFLFKNRGLLLSVAKVHYNNESQRCTLVFEDPEAHGLVDGGHTDRIIRQAIEKKPDEGGLGFPQYLKLEILEGVESFFADLADARNTSSQVADKALDELKDRFDWVHEVLDPMPYGSKIAYRQFENDIDYPIDIREIVSYLVCFNIELFSGDNHPTSAYTSKKKCLDLFRQAAEKERKGNGINSFKRLKPIIPDILRLRDFIYEKMPAIYKKESGGRFGKLRGIISDKDVPLHFLSSVNGTAAASEYDIPTAYIYPILAAFRSVIVEGEDGYYRWKTNPFQFFENEIGKALVAVTIQFGTDMRNPNTVGKAKYFWGQLYEKCEKRLKELYPYDASK